MSSDNNRDIKTESGRYALMDRLGAGQRGTVYKGLDYASGEVVAIKVVDPGSTAELVQSLDAWKLLLRLGHPNLVTIRDVDVVAKGLIIVMDYVEGVPLSNTLDSLESLSIAYTIEIATGLAGAIGHLHDHGIVHGDINPWNIMLDEETGPVLVDLGVSEMGSLASISSQVVSPHTVPRGLRFVGPEVLQFGQADVRSDVYSLGAVVYTCLLGKLPPSNALPPSIRAERPDVPSWLENIVLRCLDPDPASRFQSGSAVWDALMTRGGGSDLFGPLVLLVDSGSAPPEFIADILSDISLLYRASGGSGINFKLEDILATRGERV